MAYQVPGYSGAAAETHGASDTSYWGSSGVAGSGGGSGSSSGGTVALNKSRVNSQGQTEYLYEQAGKEVWSTTPYTGHGGTVRESNNMYAVGEDSSNVEWVNRAEQQLAMDAEIVEARRKQAKYQAMVSSAPLGEAMGQKYYQQAGDYSEAYVGRSLPGSEYKKLAEKSLKMPLTPDEAAMLREGELKYKTLYGGKIIGGVGGAVLTRETAPEITGVRKEVSTPSTVEYQVKEFDISSRGNIEMGELAGGENMGARAGPVVQTMGFSMMSLQAGADSFFNAVDRNLKRFTETVDKAGSAIASRLPKASINPEGVIGRGLISLGEKEIPLIGRLTPRPSSYEIQGGKTVEFQAESYEDMQKRLRLSSFSTGVVMGLGAGAGTTLKGLALTGGKLLVTEVIARPTVDVVANIIGGERPEGGGWTLRGAVGTGISLAGRGLVYGGLAKLEQNILARTPLAPRAKLVGVKGEVAMAGEREGAFVARAQIKDIYGVHEAGLIKAKYGELGLTETTGLGQVKYRLEGKSLLGKPVLKEGVITYGYKEPYTLTYRPKAGESFGTRAVLNLKPSVPEIMEPISPFKGTGVSVGRLQPTFVQSGIRLTTTEGLGQFKTVYVGVGREVFGGVKFDSGLTGALREGTYVSLTKGGAFKETKYLERFSQLYLEGKPTPALGGYGLRLATKEVGLKQITAQATAESISKGLAVKSLQQQSVVKGVMVGAVKTPAFSQSNIAALESLQQQQYKSIQQVSLRLVERQFDLSKSISQASIQLQKNIAMVQAKTIQGQLTTPAVLRTTGLRQEYESKLQTMQASKQMQALTPKLTQELIPKLTTFNFRPTLITPTTPKITTPILPGFGAPSGGGEGSFGRFRRISARLKTNPIATPKRAFSLAFGSGLKKFKLL